MGLCLGIGDHLHCPKLSGRVEDCLAMGDLLLKWKFVVHSGVNCGLKEMKAKVCPTFGLMPKRMCKKK